jgi:CubicO group peptidase (beta-lactamase class C family)
LRTRSAAAVPVLALLALAAGPLHARQAPEPPGPEASVAPVTWDGLPGRLEEEAKKGFSGAVRVVRDGKTVLDRGYGLANREKKIPNTPETIFAIGSTPIDFTRAGILLLAQEGKLRLSDRIGKYLDGVPADKRDITLEHLMSGRSGLRNFHDLPTDRDPDHSWIDRAEAVRRILAQQLLFRPGEGRKHSHSAWGLLAAVIEVVGGQPYPQFTRERLFRPAGMKDTGFFGEPYAEERMAIGYEDLKDGKINAPPYWGPTSWLVMGSGGQVSTTGDMVRWHEALHAGRILSKEWLDEYFEEPGGELVGGDQYGFLIVYTQGPGSLMVMTSNATPPSRQREYVQLGSRLAELVNADLIPPTTLGLQLDVRPEGVVVEAVAPGGAAERDGLRPGDVLLTAAGRPLRPRPGKVLDPLLRKGDPIDLEIERDGVRRTVRVTPSPR